MKLSIKTRIVLAIGVPLVATWLGLSWYEYRAGTDEALLDMEYYLTALTGRQAAELDARLAKGEEVVDTLAAVVAHGPDFSEQRLKQLLFTSMDSHPEVFGLGVAPAQDLTTETEKLPAPYCYRDPCTGPHCTDLAAVVPPYTSHEWYQRAESTKRPLWTDPHVRPDSDGRMVCAYVAPVVDADNFRGIVVADVLAEHLLDHVLDVGHGDEYGTLIGRDGRFIAHPDPSRIMQRADFTPAGRRHRYEPTGSVEGSTTGETGVCRIIDDRTGHPAWMAYAPVPSAPWTLATIIPESEVLAPIHARLARSLGVLLIGGLTMLGIVWFVSARVTRPINRLTEAAESLAEGDLDTHVPETKGTDEVARLARTFNTMVDDLKANVEHRIRQEAARKEVEGELHAARRIQASLLPSRLADEPDRTFAIHGVNEPAKSVAGDFFDYFFVDENTLAVVIADVSGKGVPAAIYMAVTRTMLRDFASAAETPAEVVTRLNQALARENDTTMFVTLFLGYYDVPSGELTYVNAGHNPPYLLRGSGKPETLEPTGPLVAPFADARFRDAHCRLEPRDLLILFTDGVTEAVSPNGDFYGETRLESLLAQLAKCSAERTCRRILESVDQFNPGDLADDATVLVLGRVGDAVCEDGPSATPTEECVHPV